MPQEVSREDLERLFQNIYNKLRMQFSRTAEENQAGDELTSVEKTSMEAIVALDRPKVAEFARAVQISAPNAAYRVASLVKKGYLKKTKSKKDQRQYFLEPTQKYERYQAKNRSYISRLSGQISEAFSKEDFTRLVELLTVIDENIMTKESMTDEGGNSDATGEGIKEDR